MERKVSSIVIVTDFNKGNKDSKKQDETTHKNEISLVSNKLNNVWMPIQLDGPYGTASGRIFDSQHAVLVAGGIGVTPFASILQSLWFQYVKNLKTCSNCTHQWYDKSEHKSLKKVDFIWVNRDFEAFEWFVELLGELELQQVSCSDARFLTIHLYMTSAKVEQQIECKIDPKKVILKKNSKKDASTDFKLKLIPGRPNFDKVSNLCCFFSFFPKIWLFDEK